MLELMARGGMRVSEVLKLTPNDILDRKLILNDTKSDKEQELIFIPQKVADRLKEYIKEKDIEPQQRIFPISYNAARIMVQKAGEMVGDSFKAARSASLLRIIRISQRHPDRDRFKDPAPPCPPFDNQRYLGKISATEALNLNSESIIYLKSLLINPTNLYLIVRR
jgi:hypothetical protein